MLLKHLIGFAFASAAAFCVALIAEASPRFTVQNDLGRDVEVYIYSGDDTYCGSNEKYKTVPGGKSRTYGCSGHGKGKCKIKLRAHDKKICRSDRNTCDKTAIKMEDGAKVTVKKESKDKFYCEFE